MDANQDVTFCTLGASKDCSMTNATAPAYGKQHPATDEEAIRRVLAGETAYFEVLMRRHNELLYRVLRSRFRDETAVEDAMQRAYLACFRGLSSFEGRSKFSTWLIRIALREASRERPALRIVAPSSHAPEVMTTSHPTHPEAHFARAELAQAIQQAADRLPDTLRVVFILRDVQQLTTQETAEALEIDQGAVRVRLHRARLQLRELLSVQLDDAVGATFPFHDPRCHRVVAAVFAELGFEG